MTRRHAAFSAADINRAIKAMVKAGQSVAAVDFPPEGGFRILLGDPAVLKVPTIGAPSEWDDVLSAR